eukprot:jgi/Mesvir1/8169/Mv12474-RA.2
MPADEEVFRMREEEKKARSIEKERTRKLGVAEKSTFASRMGTTLAPDSRTKTDLDTILGKVSLKDGREGSATLPTEHRRREKETMADFIAKKREIFLVQMSLDTKRTEIRKLEERALQREEALKKSELMLEEDALRFDAFLKENDEKVQEAIKWAEVEAKAKQDKVHEIKRLNAAIATIRSELNKYEEQLEDCRKYKEFLDSLTPQEWFTEQEELRRKAKELRQAQRRAERRRRREEERQAAEASEAAAAAASPPDNSRGASKDGPRGPRDKAAEDKAAAEAAAAAAAKAAAQAAEDAEDDKEEEEDEEDGDGLGNNVPMYFHHPQQLLDMFAQLEEQNLFLIQNCQETEEALEELKSKFRETQARMEGETGGLNQQIKGLEDAIAAETAKAALLRDKSNEHAGMSGQENSLEELAVKVADVYSRCGFDNDASIGMLQMLTNVEARLEEYLSVIDKMPPEFVESLEKAKEKDRRQRMREEKLEAQKREQEKRVQRSLERAQAPVHKRTGKTLMFRSQPLNRKKDENKDQGPKKTDEEEELAAFLARDY